MGTHVQDNAPGTRCCARAWISALDDSDIDFDVDIGGTELKF